jgi:serine/threonine protein kinase/outer membrane protein assembly factor BamB
MAVIFSKGDKLEQNHYTVLQELGLGGMGVVYQCRDEQLMRDVAIKMLLPELMANKASAEVFRQEARLAAQLEHPNIVTVYDIGVEERQRKQHHFVCMEYLPGGNLAHRLSTEKLEVELCLNWMKQLASGLAFAHKRNVVHQDIKADNIFITNEGDLKIGDFGLARLLVGRVHSDSTIKGMGTPAYMSPELCRGEPQDHRSDIYSLGILFFEMATGHLPFKARGMIEMATKHSSAPIPSAKRLNPLIPEVLDKVIRRMMGKIPEDRYNSMSEVLTLLDDLIFEMRVKRMGLSTNRPVMRSGPIASETVEAVQHQVRAQAQAQAQVQAQVQAQAQAQVQAQAQAKVQAQAQAKGQAKIELPKSAMDKFVARTGQSDIQQKASPTVPEPGPSSAELIAQLEANSKLNSTAAPRPATASGIGKISIQKAGSGSSWAPSLTSDWHFQTNGPIGWSSAPVLDKAEKIFFVGSADGSVYAIELQTGKLKWRHTIGAPLLASPTLIGDKLFIADSAGKMQAINAESHETLWQREINSPVVSTPAYFKDILFVPTEGGRMVALDIASGSTRWEFKAESAIVSSPHRHAELVLFGTRNGAFHAISAETGRAIWKFHAGEPIVASPAASVDSVYFGTQSGTFFALEADTGGLIWEYPTDRAIISKALIAFTAVIFCSHDRWLYCCEKYDGGLKWKASVRGKAIANLVVHKETVLVATQEGWLQAFHTRTGNLVWQIDLGRKLDSSPVISGDHLLQATVEGEILALSSKQAEAVG